MRIDQILADSRPVFSFEFFPPRDPDGIELLLETVATLKPLAPDYVSVTYGAGGATRDGTVEIATRLKQEHGLEAMAHLSCVGETSTSSPCAGILRAAKPSSPARREG